MSVEHGDEVSGMSREHGDDVGGGLHEVVDVGGGPHEVIGNENVVGNENVDVDSGIVASNDGRAHEASGGHNLHVEMHDTEEDTHGGP
ncbi:hypothetical protein Dimus_001772, partial [Dionaea muscipula]